MRVWCRQGSAQRIIGNLASHSLSDCWTRIGIDEWTERVEEDRKGKQHLTSRVAKVNHCNTSATFASG